MTVNTGARGSATAMLFVLLLCVNSAFANDWKLAKDKNGIKVYTKKTAGSNLKAFRGETVIAAEILEIAALFNTDYAYALWLADIKKSQLVNRINSTEQHIYLIQKLPLIKDRDVVVHGHMTQDLQTKILSVKVTGVDNVLAKTPKYIRIEKLHGSFIFKPIGDGELHVTYEVDVDPGGRIPTPIANAFAVNSPFKTLRNLRKLSGKLAQFADPDVVLPFENVPR